MSLIQTALRNGTETVQSLTDKYFIKVKSHSKYGGLLQFKYDQINSPMGNPLVQEARGIILDSEDDWRVKMADLRHNTDIRRLKGVTQKDLDRVQKYHEFYLELQAMINAGA